jgi:uncharacterized protein
MVLMPSTDLTPEEKNMLMDIARQSIASGLKNCEPLLINASDYSSNLQALRATFVTLEINQQLRGCIGTLEAYLPLVKDVSEHAFAAAFKDPRFSRLTKSEENLLEIHISILTPATSMSFESENDLMKQIQPGIDGLILESGSNKGTFLPSVWGSLPQTKDFFRHLKMKAGLPGNYWSDDIKISRYKTISIP